VNARTRTALTTLALTAAAAGAAAWAFFGVEKGTQKEKEQKEVEARLVFFDKAKVKEVLVEAKGEKTRLVHGADGSWQVAEPVKAPGDKGAAEAILDKLVLLRRKSEVKKAGEVKDDQELGAFGLAKPRAKVTVTPETGAPEWVALGDDQPFDNSIYARSTDGSVALVGGDAKFPLEKSSLELREKRVLVFEDKDVKKVDILGPSLAYGFEKDGEHWKLTAPLPDKADDATVTKILGALRSLRAEAFAPADPGTMGLAKPRWTVELVRSDGSTWSLAIGEGERAGKKQLFARRADGVLPDVAVLPETAAKDLDADTFALRDKTVVAFDRDKVGEVKLKVPAGELVVKKEMKSVDGGPAEETWSLVTPRKAPAKRWKISGFLYTLSSLKATAFTDETGKHASELGFDKPAATISLLDGEGKELAKIELGREGSGKQAFRSSQSPRIFDVDKQRLSEMPRKVEDLEDKEEKPAPQPSPKPG
jgi:hypothetical protein